MVNILSDICKIVYGKYKTYDFLKLQQTQLEFYFTEFPLSFPLLREALAD